MINKMSSNQLIQGGASILEEHTIIIKISK